MSVTVVLVMLIAAVAAWEIAGVWWFTRSSDTPPADRTTDWEWPRREGSE
jgi:hypothetical protein